MRERAYTQCRWTAVTDASGRTRLEMRWEPVAPAADVPGARAA